MTLACDLDGVLANLHTVILQDVSLLVGRAVTLNAITEFNWWTQHFDEDVGRKILDRYIHAWDYYDPDAIEPYERDLATITFELRECFDGLDIVTQHPESCRDRIQKWLCRWDVNYDRLFLVGNTDKATLDYYDYIDDNPLLAESLKRDPTKELYLYDQPWNRMVRPRRGLTRIRHLREILL